MQKEYEINFKWKQGSTNKRFLDYVECDGINIPGEATWEGGIANFLVQLTTNEMQDAAGHANVVNVLKPPRGRFVYMDVGKWCGGRQSFGVIWKDTAVICDFIGPASPTKTGTGNLLEQFLNIGGICELARLTLDTPYPESEDVLHIILPDMHVPPCPPREWPRPTVRWRSPEERARLPAWQWGSEYYDIICERDLFKSRVSIPKLTAFLNLIADTPYASNIRMTQIGDMYELWMKQPLLFKRKPNGPPGVDLEPMGAWHVGRWLCDIHEFYPELFEAFDLCVEKLGKGVNFLHGNHDCYLSVPEVIAEANKQIAELAAQPKGRQNYSARMKPTRVHQRVASGFAFDSGVYIEHGQRCDKFNSDGDPDGHKATQHGGDWPFKNFDSIRRGSFVAAASALWLVESQAFSCYVMGHTHEPALAYVNVTGSVGDFAIDHFGRRVWVEKPKK